MTTSRNPEFEQYFTDYYERVNPQPFAPRMPDVELDVLNPRTDLIQQPSVMVFKACPCGRCTAQRREEYELAKRTAERSLTELCIPPRPCRKSEAPNELPTQQDRDVLDALDILAKIAVVFLIVLFIVVCYHAYATHAVERMLSR